MEVTLVDKCSVNAPVIERNSFASILGSEQDDNGEHAEYFELFTVDEDFEGSLSCVPRVSPLSVFSNVKVVSGDEMTQWNEGDWITNENGGGLLLKNVKISSTDLPCILHIRFLCPKSTSEAFFRSANDPKSLAGLLPLLWSDYLKQQYNILSTRSYVVALQRQLNDYNKLSGNIPIQPNQLSYLKRLDLSNNQLSGNIPSELGQLSSLEQLLLNDNQLSGNIPNELRGLSSLQYLYLNYNQLSGNIPSELGSLTNLKGLYLSNNQLSGNIPRELSNLSSLQYLYLNRNQLSGNIPIELGKLSSLFCLYLNYNQLSGNIPEELCRLSLQWLYLNNNQLSGNIPSILGNLTSLRWLFLNNNQLSGNIPNELLCNSKIIGCNLSENYFLEHETGNRYVKLWKMENYNKALPRKSAQ